MFAPRKVKILPDGEPVQLTHDSVLKTDPTFSTDGSRIAYTTLALKDFAWDTAVLPILGGKPQPLLRNASGLTWIGPNHVMFSEIKAGIHMGIVAAEEGRLRARDISFSRVDCRCRSDSQHKIAEAIESANKPQGVGVVIEARHLCMMMRGVEKQHSSTITSSMLGAFRQKETRDEFLALIRARDSAL